MEGKGSKNEKETAKEVEAKSRVEAKSAGKVEAEKECKEKK